VIDKLATLFYWLNIRTWAALLMLISVKLHLEGKENIPRHGPLIFVSNHLNNADSLALTAMFPRRIVWMVKTEWFSTPVVGWLFHLFGLIPVRRFEADLKALRQAQRALDRGSVLGMFPEGTRSRTAALAQGEPGTAVIALRTGAQILPVAIWGTENVKLPRDFFRRNRIYMSIGRPFRLPEAKRVNKQTAESGTREIMKRIAELLPEKFRGVYADTVGSLPATAKTE
jgi:1-acyl-sn-glycerol-3-phosphate acyltransferase